MLFVYIRWGSSVFAPLVETLSDLQALTIVAEGCQRGLHKERCRVFFGPCHNKVQEPQHTRMIFKWVAEHRGHGRR